MKMKTSLEHLPASKQEQILAISRLLQAEIPAEMIILFGSHARGDWVEDHDTRYFSDYDLLVVVAEAAQVKQLGSGNALWTRVRAIAGHVPVSPIVHDVKQLNKEIRAGQYFFVDILREGVRLHDSRRFQLAVPKVLGTKERLEHARFNFRYWFNSASNFWRGAGYFMERKLDAHAAFLLHQTAERYFHAALLVFGGYKPRTHDLAVLAKDTALLHPALAGAMPRAAGEDERLFDLLRRAYIEARYSQSYHVTDEELVRLRAVTLDLGVRVREACVEMMGTFCGPEVVGELPQVPGYDEEELGEPPPVEDVDAFKQWRRMLRRLSYEEGELVGELRGLAQGKHQGYEEGVRYGIERGAEQGEKRGRREAQAEALLAIFEARGFELKDEIRTRIDTCPDPMVLKRWIMRAATASSAEQALAPERDPAPGS